MSGDGSTGLCAVLDPERGARHAVELRGPLDVAAFQRALHRIAESHPGHRLGRPRLLRHGPRLHTVELPADGSGSTPYPVGLLVDLLTAPPEPVTAGPAGTAGQALGAGGQPCGTLPRTEAVMPLQRRRLADALARPDHHVEQLVWRWHGPLDLARFAASWQAVGERESVLRTAFVWDPHPRALVFDHGAPEIVRHSCRSAARRASLRTRERSRAFDLRSPGLLRVALLEEDEEGSAEGTDVLLTYHRALLDSWSVRLLMRECCRAYLAGGVLPGGERRPDLSDCARRLGGQDHGPSGDAEERPAPTKPAGAARTGPALVVGSGGTGLHRARLSPAESTRLTRWAGAWGVAESSVVQAVWAMLVYGGSGAAPRPATVGFGLGLPGRGLLIDGIEGTPGPFENSLPASVRLDPSLGVRALLRELRDRALDLAASEWLAARAEPGTSGGAEDEGDAETDMGPSLGSASGGLVVFDYGPRPEDLFGDALAAQGVRVEEQEIAGALTGYAVGLRAGHDVRRGLVLSCAYDRDRIEGGSARTLLGHVTRLLCLLPGRADATTTVADVLGWLPDVVLAQVPFGAGPFNAIGAAPLVPLRAASAPSASTVYLVDVPGAPRTGHWELVRHYGGPEALTALGLTTPEGAARTAGSLAAPAARSGRRVILGGYAGAGALACELARHIAESDVRPPLVVIGGSPGDPACTRALAELLRELSA